MKLKMCQLIKIVKPMLLDLGFTYFPHKRAWTGGIFCKKEPNGMYLTIGMNTHRFYDCYFNIEMYYSTETSIGALYGDIPAECYVRPGDLLNKKTRILLSLPTEPLDLWWDSLDPNTLNTIKKVIKISEQELLSDKVLLKRVKSSKDTQKILNISLDIMQLVENNEIDKDIEYQFAPEKTTSGIPVIWFQAAEIICKKYHGKINKNSVYWSAGDAYRIYTLNKMQDGE